MALFESSGFISSVINELDSTTIAILSIISVIMTIRMIIIAKDEMDAFLLEKDRKIKNKEYENKKSLFLDELEKRGGLVPTKESNRYKRFVREYGVDDYDFFKDNYDVGRDTGFF